MDFFLFKSAISRRFCNQGFLASDVLSNALFSALKYAIPIKFAVNLIKWIFRNGLK